MPAHTISKHHLIPRSRKGTETVPLHAVCHNKIHSVFTEKELERTYNTLALLLEHADIRNFVQWVAKKPPDFYIRTKEKR
jgi:hypothetical protein